MGGLEVRTLTRFGFQPELGGVDSNLKENRHQTLCCAARKRRPELELNKVTFFHQPVRLLWNQSAGFQVGLSNLNLGLALLRFRLSPAPWAQTCLTGETLSAATQPLGGKCLLYRDFFPFWVLPVLRIFHPFKFSCLKVLTCKHSTMAAR